MPSTGEPPTPPRRRSGRNPDDVKGVLEEHGVGGSGRRSKAKKSKVDGHAADSAKHRPLFPDPSSKGVPVPTQTANHTKAGGVVPRYQDHTASSQAKARTSRAGSKRPTGRQLSSRHGRGKNSYMDARDVDVAVPRDPRVVAVSTAPKVLPKAEGGGSAAADAEGGGPGFLAFPLPHSHIWRILSASLRA